MIKIIAAKDFSANNVVYIAGDEINGLTYEQILKLNEKGFIKPLNYKELALIKRELDKTNKNKEEFKWH